MKYNTIESREFWEAREIECKDTGEKVVGYKSYLKTAHWKQKRLDIYRKYNRHCAKCGKAVQMSQANIHHKTYAHVGDELDEDLVLLCIYCHRAVHGLKPKVKKSWKEKTWIKKKKPK